MALSNTLNARSNAPSWRDYLTLTKPRVVAVMVLTSMVGMLLARPVLPSVELFILANLGIALAASAAAAINHVVDRRIDAVMNRTKHRPVSDGKVSPAYALMFAFLLGASGLSILAIIANPLTAWLTFASIIGYAVIYTLYLKRATPQNIVIGGLAGAAPPLLGWTAVTGYFDGRALLLVLIIFAWTPPHFWALAIYRLEEYKKAAIPMLPVTHGVQFTKLHVVLYTVLLLIASALPVVVGMSGMIYALTAALLGARFLWWAIRLYRATEGRVAMQTFRFSIVYLMLLFVGLLFDHYW